LVTEVDRCSWMAVAYWMPNYNRALKGTKRSWSTKAATRARRKRIEKPLILRGNRLLAWYLCRFGPVATDRLCREAAPQPKLLASSATLLLSTPGGIGNLAGCNHLQF